MPSAETARKRCEPPHGTLTYHEPILSSCISEFQRPQQRLLECTDGPQIESVLVTMHWLLFSSMKKRSPQLEESSTQMLLQCIKTLVQWQHCLSMNSWISIAGLATCGDLQTQHGFALSTRHTKHKYTVSKTEDKRKKTKNMLKILSSS